MLRQSFRSLRFRSQCSAALLAVALLSFIGCGYGEVNSKTYEFATATYNISNRRLPERIEGIQQQISEALAQDEISSQEAKWLNDILAQAKNENWSRAMRDARRLMEAQLTK